MIMNCRDGQSATWRRTLIRFVVGAILLVAASVLGQVRAIAQTPPVNSTSALPSTHSETSAPAVGQKKPPENTRVLEDGSWFFPDIAHTGKPLTSGEKFKLAIVNSVSPGTFLGSALGAGIGQATNSPAGWGQGSGAYGQRFGASMAKSASNNLIGRYFLSAVLHDDPRYFVRGDGSLKQSIQYALRRVVIVRKDNGREAFNWPGVLGPLGAAGLANTYLPDAQRTVGYTFENYGWSIASSAGVNLLKEYWPTITRKVLVPLGISHDSHKSSGLSEAEPGR